MRLRPISRVLRENPHKYNLILQHSKKAIRGCIPRAAGGTVSIDQRMSSMSLVGLAFRP
jgi:hypothetical protein